MKKKIIGVVSLILLFSMLICLPISATQYAYQNFNNVNEFSGELFCCFGLLAINDTQAVALLNVTPHEDFDAPIQLTISTQLIFEYSDGNVTSTGNSQTCSLQWRSVYGVSQSNSPFVAGAQYNCVIGEYFISCPDNDLETYENELYITDGYFPEGSSEARQMNEIVYFPGIDF